MPFNEAQLSTLEKAQELAATLNAINVGNGVKKETKNPDTSGIYIPNWLGGPSNFEQPNGKDPDTGEKTQYWHFRFNNGAEGVNVGLILDRLKRYPFSPGYVFRSLAVEVDSLKV